MYPDNTLKRAYAFISHSSKDNTISAGIANGLRTQGVSVWIDLENIRDGDSWLRTIDTALRDAAVLVIVMTPNALASDWVERETLLALELNIPILIAYMEEVALPLHLINRQFTDFRKESFDVVIKTFAGAIRKQMRTRYNHRTLPMVDGETIDPLEILREEEVNFFNYIDRKYKSILLVKNVRLFYYWARARSDSIKFSMESRRGFHAQKYVISDLDTILTMWAYSQKAYIEIPLQRLKKLSPYTDKNKLQSLIDRINSLFPESSNSRIMKLSGRPNIPLDHFANARQLQAFTSLFDEVIDNLTTPETFDENILTDQDNNDMFMAYQVDLDVARPYIPYSLPDLDESESTQGMEPTAYHQPLPPQRNEINLVLTMITTAHNPAPPAQWRFKLNSIFERIVIGRKGDYNPHVDLSLVEGSRSVSRMHAEIKFNAGHVYLRDIKSTNGTFINQRRLIKDEQFHIHDSDIIRIGEVQISVSIH